MSAIGTNFCPSPCPPVEIEFNGEPVQQRVPVLPDGSFRANFTVPGSAQGGQNAVIATQPGGATALTYFTLTPSTPAPRSANTPTAPQTIPPPTPTATHTTTATPTPTATPTQRSAPVTSSTSTTSSATTSTDTAQATRVSASTKHGGGGWSLVVVLLVAGGVVVALLGGGLYVRARQAR